jgi:hypothetical protein
MGFRRVLITKVTSGVCFIVEWEASQLQEMGEEPGDEEVGASAIGSKPAVDRLVSALTAEGLLWPPR